jgi:hypothetical protein
MVNDEVLLPFYHRKVSDRFGFGKENPGDAL